MGDYYESFEPPFFLWYKSKDRLLERNNLAYERPDAAIVQDILQHFSTLHHIDTSEVTVTSDHNIVTLKGKSLDERVGRYLCAIADNTLGVRSVVSELSYGF